MGSHEPTTFSLVQHGYETIMASPANALMFLTTLLLIGITLRMFFGRKSPKFDPNGKHCFITGGSQGLGLSFAKMLAKQGAHVTIAARRADKLQTAVEEIISHAKTKSQIISYVCADVSDPISVQNALNQARNTVGTIPEYVFCCAGAATPGWFVEQDPALLERGMKVNYLGSAYTAQAAAKLMIEENVQGKIVFVGSTVSLIGLVGYTQYAPAKAALKNLADCLRQELELYSISVHIYLPGTILSPGYEEENKTKPRLLKEIEGTAAALTPQQCAEGLMKGLEKDVYAITTDFDTELIRAITSGLAPKTNWIASGFVKFDHDRKIQKEKQLRITKYAVKS